MSQEHEKILIALEKDPDHPDRPEWEEFLAQTLSKQLATSLNGSLSKNSVILNQICCNLLWIRSAHIEEALKLFGSLSEQAALRTHSDPLSPLIHAAQGRAAFGFDHKRAQQFFATAWTTGNKKLTNSLEQLLWDLDQPPVGPINPQLTLLLGQAQLPTLFEDPYRRELCYIQMARAHRTLNHKGKEKEFLGLAAQAQSLQPIKLPLRPNLRFGL
jgi:hypothetical protein